MLASRANGQLFVDTLKNNRARTVPLVADLVPIVAGRAAGRQPADWLFAAPAGGPLSEANWKRSVGWAKAIAKIGVPDLRVHALRHTTASVWLGAGADPKVVQRILGHASAAILVCSSSDVKPRVLGICAARLSSARISPSRVCSVPTHSSPGRTTLGAPVRWPLCCPG